MPLVWASERAASDADALPDLALSSAEEIERYGWFGDRWVEVLDHTPEAISTARMTRGLPLLLDHDSRQQVGRIENLRVEDGVMRGTPRFSRSQTAQEIAQDVRDGIRTDVSVGYRILEWREVEQRDGVPVIRVTRWEPMEGSLVAIPADVTVGVGRSDEAAAAPNQDETASTTTGSEPEEEQMEETRVAAAVAAPTGAGLAPEMRSALQAAEALGLDAKTQMRMVTEGAKPEDVLAAAIKAQEARMQAAPSATVDMSAKEQESYSLVRGLQSLLKGQRAGFEFEVSQELEKRFGAPKQGGFLVPANVSAPMGRTLLNVGTGSKGGNLEFDAYGGFIDFLRNRTVAAQAGATILSGLQGDLAFVEQTASTGLTWGAETAGASAASMTLAIKRLQPKQATARLPYTRMLEQQSIEAIENLVRQDIFGQWAVGVDTVALNGGGASEPTGILSNTSVSAVTIGAQGGTAGFATWLSLAQTVADNNALIGNPVFVTTPGVAKNAMLTPRFTNTGIPIWDGNITDGDAVGYRAVATNSIPKTYTKGTTTALHGIVFGNFNDLLIGQFGSLEVWADPYTAAPHTITVWAIGMVDVLLRRTQSFAFCKEAIGT